MEVKVRQVTMFSNQHVADIDTAEKHIDANEKTSVHSKVNLTAQQVSFPTVIS